MSHRKPSRRGAGPAAQGVNPRQPCPCGSGRRYKSCHGSGEVALVTRPFAGLASECDWVALRELVPAATAPLRLRTDGDRKVTLATVLPMALPAIVRGDGRILLGLQVHTTGNDVSRDVAAALELALVAEPGTMLPSGALAGPGPRLKDLLADEPLDVTVHEDFGFWLEGSGATTAEVEASLEKANAAILPTVRLTELEAAYWCDAGDQAHLRWVLPDAEDVLLDALARLGAADELHLSADSHYAGSFRAHGVLAPVWDLPVDAPAQHWQRPAEEFADRLRDALAAPGELTDAERRARAGLRGRQLTLH